MVKCPAALPVEVWTPALRAQVNRLAHLDADALVGHNISAFDLDILLHRLEKHKARLMRCLEYICNERGSKQDNTRPLAAEVVGLLLAAITPAMAACPCAQYCVMGPKLYRHCAQRALTA
jgi:DNA polymerase elongation subunit (family B)